MVLSPFGLERPAQKETEDSSASPFNSEYAAIISEKMREQRRDSGSTDASSASFSDERKSIRREVRDNDIQWKLELAGGTTKQDATKKLAPKFEQAIDAANRHYDSVGKAVSAESAENHKAIEAYDKRVEVAEKLLHDKLAELPGDKRSQLTSDIERFCRYDGWLKVKEEQRKRVDGYPGLLAAADNLEPTIRKMQNFDSEKRYTPEFIKLEQDADKTWESVDDVMFKLPRSQRNAAQAALHDYVNINVSKMEFVALESRLRAESPVIMKVFDNLVKVAHPIKLDSVYATNLAHNGMTMQKYNPLQERMADAMEVRIGALDAYSEVLKEAGDKARYSEINKQAQVLRDKVQIGSVFPSSK